jgi:hypothetical protein
VGAAEEHDLKHSVVPYTLNASSFSGLPVHCYFGVVHPKASSVIVGYVRAFTKQLLWMISYAVIHTDY